MIFCTSSPHRARWPYASTLGEGGSATSERGLLPAEGHSEGLKARNMTARGETPGINPP